MKTLTIGGPASYYQQKIAPFLPLYGLEPTWHWDTGYWLRPDALPKGCEVVIFLSEMAAHSSSRVPIIREMCEAAGAKFVSTTHKKAGMHVTFEKLGITPIVGGFALANTVAATATDGVVNVAEQKKIDVNADEPGETFEQTKTRFKEVLREMRDWHHVVTISFDAEAGLEIIRKQHIVEEL